MPRKYGRYCFSCRQYTYQGSGRCSNFDTVNPCPLNNPAGSATSSGTTAHDAQRMQHQSWQEDVWAEEKTSEKETKRQRWQNRQPWKRQRRDYDQTQPDQGAPAPEMPRPKTPPPVPPPPTPPPKKPAPKPAPKARPKAPPVPPPKAPPWRQWYRSDSEDYSSDEVTAIIQTPGPIIEELLPELEWYPEVTGFELQDGADPAAGQIIPPAFTATSEAATDDSVNLIEEEVEEEHPLEEDPVVSSFEANQEAKQSLMLAQLIMNEGDEPMAEPSEHATRFSPEPEKEVSPNAAVDEASFCNHI